MTSHPAHTHADIATTPPARGWAGGAAMWPGVGLFIGRAGDNQEHRHWAHQLVIGLEGEVELSSGAVSRSANALFVQAGAPHRLTPAVLLMVFLDPTTELSQALCRRVNGAQPSPEDPGGADAIRILPPDLAALFRNALTGTLDIETAAEHIRAELVPGSKTPDARIRRVLAALAPGAGRSSRPDRRQLAELAGLSETRFSHWFKEATGMPLRSYRKWLNLVHGLEHALHGQNLTAAAHQADFADQAHFSRTFVEMFGVRASDVLAQVSLMPVAGQRLPVAAAKRRAPAGMSFVDARTCLDD